MINILGRYVGVGDAVFFLSLLIGVSIIAIIWLLRIGVPWKNKGKSE